MGKIRVDIDELLSRLQEMQSDDYATVQLEITSEKFSNELVISAVSFEYDEPIPYGTLGESEDEL